jgi:recombination protein RecR
MDSIAKLTEMFRKFPGIGPRQARRFAYFLLSADSSYVSSLSTGINSLKKETSVCSDCRRYFAKSDSRPTCAICSDTGRDKTLLTIVSTDVDMDAFEKSGVYEGMYFVLGGYVPLIETDEPEKRIRAGHLTDLIKRRSKDGLSEIIFALSATPEGEHTASFLADYLSKLAEDLNFKITHLGKGLSTGTELEYADSETIKNALKNRE